MDKVIPILPCPDIRQQAEFYQQLGFEIKGLFTSPNPYAALQFDSIELHFWGSRKNSPANNSSMCFVQVEDVDAIYDGFVKRLKMHTGKVPRTGLPRISKVRDLANDRRFTMTDPGGNTLFIGTPKVPGAANFFRTLDNEKLAKKFAILYDVVYSKEDPALAAGTLSTYGIDKESLNDLDKAKYLLVLADINRAVGKPADDAELVALLQEHKEQTEWKRLAEKYAGILQEE